MHTPGLVRSEPGAGSRPPSRVRSLARAAALVACATASVAAPAQGFSAPDRPWYLGVGLAGIRDSNPGKVPDAQDPKADRYLEGSLFGGLNARFGRQSAFLNGELRSSAKRDPNESNGYTLRTGLNWETVNRLSGEFGAAASRNLARGGVAGVANTNEKNFETVTDLRAGLSWGAPGRLQLYGEVVGNQLDFSSDAAAQQRLEQAAASGGVRYRTSEFLTVGLGYRATQGKYPDFFPLGANRFSPLDFDRSDIDLTVNFTASGASALFARISSTKQEFEQDPSRDTDGVTGELTWNWRPTGRLGFVASAVRETGAAATFRQLAPTPTAPGTTGTPTGTTGTPAGTTAGTGAPNSTTGQTASTAINSPFTNTAFADASSDSTGLRLGGTYALTAKTAIDFGVGRVQRKFTGTTSFTETTNTISAGVAWAPLRNVNLRCQVVFEDRSGPAAQNIDYSANIATCAAQYVLN
jgi:hypothetical protein